MCSMYVCMYNLSVVLLQDFSSHRSEDFGTFPLTGDDGEVDDDDNYEGLSDDKYLKYDKVQVVDSPEKVFGLLNSTRIFMFNNLEFALFAFRSLADTLSTLFNGLWYTRIPAEKQSSYSTPGKGSYKRTAPGGILWERVNNIKAIWRKANPTL